MKYENELIKLLMEQPGLTDREITDELLGKNEQPQKINRICNELAVQGKIIRIKKDLTRNYLASAEINDTVPVPIPKDTHIITSKVTSMIDMHVLMHRLSLQGRVFCSEADFQFALAWEIQKSYPHINVRLEKQYSESVHIDIWLVNGNDAIPIELKYKTKKSEFTCGDEQVILKNQGAQDIGRYDVLKDVERVETIVTTEKLNYGYVILLTNDELYWKIPTSEKNTIDKMFKINEGCIITGKLQWEDHAGEGTTKNREKPIVLNNTYNIKWSVFRSGHEPCGIFKYVVFDFVKTEG